MKNLIKTVRNGLIINIPEHMCSKTPMSEEEFGRRMNEALNDGNMSAEMKIVSATRICIDCLQQAKNVDGVVSITDYQNKMIVHFLTSGATAWEMHNRQANAWLRGGLKQSLTELTDSLAKINQQFKAIRYRK